MNNEVYIPRARWWQVWSVMDGLEFTSIALFVVALGVIVGITCGAF